MNVIFISGIFMSFFIVLLLLTKKNKALNDKILAAWISIIGIHLLGYYFNQMGYWDKYPNLIGVTAPVPLFHGPLLYLYCLYSFRSESSMRNVDYLHFVPGIAAYIYMFKFFFFYSAQQKILVDKGEISDFSIFSVILLFAMFISGLAYSFLAYRLTSRHKQTILDNFSHSEGISLKWLRYCIVSIGLVFFCAVIVFVLRNLLEFRFPFNPEYIFYSIMIVFIFYIGYFGIRQENIFISNPVNEDIRNDKSSYFGKYSRSGLKEDVAIRLFDKLLTFMEEEKPYLDPHLTLSQLAGKMGISNNQLSQVINQKAGVNFHDFVNKYRIEEFLRNAGKNKHFSLLALALDAGFNSKSSFNYIFKKQKGLSPSQYLSKKM
jgi:AraC-like DNA-binding protein